MKEKKTTEPDLGKTVLTSDGVKIASPSLLNIDRFVGDAQKRKKFKLNGSF
jgi:hypothetical protein